MSRTMAFTVQLQSLRSCSRSIPSRISSTPMNYLSSLSKKKHVDEKNQSTKLNEETTTLKPLVVCGPSGVGKGTIISNFMEKDGGAKFFGFTVSHTTRGPRPGEIDGEHYHFVPYDKMKEAISNHEFLEHADVHGNLYGTSFQSISHVQEQLSKHCLLDIDVQGVQNVKNHQYMEEKNNNDTKKTTKLKPKYVFIAPPSVEVLRERLINRKTESKESLMKRTQNAKEEIDYGLKDGNFDCVIVNDNLEEACKTFKDVVASLYDDVRLLED